MPSVFDIRIIGEKWAALSLYKLLLKGAVTLDRNYKTINVLLVLDIDMCF